MAKRARQADLPTMEDRAIKALEDCAVEYAEIRDARMALTTQETALQKKVLAVMKRHQKTRYVNGLVEIDVIPPAGVEKVRVKLRKVKDGGDNEDEEDSDGA